MTVKTGKKNRRRLPFVRHSVQWNYLKVVLLAMCLPMFISTGCLYYLIWQTVANQLAIPELIVETLFPAFKQVNQILLIGLPVVCLFIFFFAVRVSHRLAGPLYRIEKELDEIAATNDFSRRIKIRPDDELRPLVSKINRILDALKH